MTFDEWVEDKLTEVSCDEVDFMRQAWERALIEGERRAHAKRKARKQQREKQSQIAKRKDKLAYDKWLEEAKNDPDGGMNSRYDQ